MHRLEKVDEAANLFNCHHPSASHVPEFKEMGLSPKEFTMEDLP